MKVTFWSLSATILHTDVLGHWPLVIVPLPGTAIQFGVETDMWAKEAFQEFTWLAYCEYA